MNTITETGLLKTNLPSKSRFSLSLGIRGRLLIGFGAVLFIFILATLIALVKIYEAESYSKRVLEVKLPTYESLLDLHSQINQTQSDVRAWLILPNVEFKKEWSIIWNDISTLEKAINQLSLKWAKAEDVSKWDKIKVLLLELNSKQKSLLSFLGNNSTDLTLHRKELAEQTLIVNQLNDLLQGPLNVEGKREGGMMDDRAAELSQGATVIVDNMRWLEKVEYFLLSVGVFISILIAFYTIRSILRHVNIFRAFSSRIAAGDLTDRIVIESHDEIGLLGNDLNIMTDSLATITRKISEACLNMVSTLEEVKRSVNVQSAGSSEQASSINQITASLEEIEKSSTQTMEKAKALGEAAERTREKGQQGLEAVEQSIEGMNAVKSKVQMIAQTILDLSNKTQQVGEITSVVNSLAQQSKMLALNASIEAAKAGEAGKGFAVVAIEVKNLAEQSEQSTVQVQKILEDIRHATEKAVISTEEGTKGVDYGTSLVEQTGEIVRSLTNVIDETTTASQQIEAAVHQESVGIEQITAGMDEINQVTASYVESVKQTTEAIDNLALIAKSLKEHIQIYKIESIK